MFYQAVGKNVAWILGNFGMKFGLGVGLGGIIVKYWHNVGRFLGWLKVILSVECWKNL